MITKKQKKQIFIISLISILFILLLSSGNLKNIFSVVSISSVPFEEGGKVYWLISSVGDSIDEGFSFTYKVGDTIKDYTKKDGTIVKPKKSMTLFFSKKESNCKYTFLQETKKMFFGLFDFDYYILSNPSRSALIKIKDSQGKEVIIDGAVNGDIESIEDSDGKGKVIIKALGLISVPADCPNYENVVMALNGQGGYKIVNMIDYEKKLDTLTLKIILESLKMPLLNLKIFNVQKYLADGSRENNQFISSFNLYPSIDSNSKTLTGDIDIGNGFFTITADQDYFDSVLYVPSKQTDPVIADIFVNDMERGSTSSVRVDIKNRVNTEEKVLLKATAENSGITPQSKSFILKTTSSQYFTLTASSNLGEAKVCFEACSTPQFESPKCDNKCESFKIVTKSESGCGNNICESNENNATCPKDCLIDRTISDGKVVCSSCDAYAKSILFGWVDSLGITKNKISCQAAGGSLFPPKLPQSELSCATDFLKYVLVIFATLFSFIFGLGFFKGYKATSGNTPLIWVLSIIIAIAVGYATFTLWWLAIIEIILLLILRSVIGVGRGYLNIK